LEIDRERCSVCGDCADLCYAEALEVDSFRMTAEAVIDKAERDKVFYQVSAEGGVTLCGGEPLAQPEFALEVLRLCKTKGFHTAIETCGNYPFGALERALPYLDLVYFDLKHMQAEEHKRYTGADNELVRENLRKLQAFDVEVCVRVPVIPTLNDSPENMEATALFVKELPKVRSVELLPYHRLGVSKYEKMGLEYPLRDLPTPQPEGMRKLVAIFEAHGICCEVQGRPDYV
jgi:pyruvate formate lyase activating enzyme